MSIERIVSDNLKRSLYNKYKHCLSIRLSIGNNKRHNNSKGNVFLPIS